MSYSAKHFSDKHVVETASTGFSSTPLFVAEGVEERVLHNIARDGLEDIKYKGPGLASLESVDARYTRFRRADGMGPDGDALQAFDRSSLPLNLVVRKRPPASSQLKLVKLRLNPKNKMVMQKLQRLQRRGLAMRYWHCIYHKRYVAPPDGSEARAVRSVFPVHDALVPVMVPNVGEALESVADGVGVWNEENQGGVLLEPYLEASLGYVAAACTIQACWRSLMCRRRMEPPLEERLLLHRAALTIQRYRQTRRLNARMSMLVRVKNLVAKIGEHTTLCLSHKELKYLNDQIDDPRPMRSFTEHGIQFSFDGLHRIVLVKGEGVGGRYGIPAHMTAATIPVVSTPEECEAAGVMGDSIDYINAMLLLTTNTDRITVPEEPELSDKLRQRGFVLPYEDKPAMIMTFESAEEARRRAALLFLLTWSPRRGSGASLELDPTRPLTPVTPPATLLGRLSRQQSLAWGGGVLGSNELAELLPPDSKLRRFVGEGIRFPDDPEVLGPWGPNGKPLAVGTLRWLARDADPTLSRHLTALGREKMARKYGVHFGVMRDILLVQSHEDRERREWEEARGAGGVDEEPPEVSVIRPHMDTGDFQNARAARELGDAARDGKLEERKKVETELERNEEEMAEWRRSQIEKGCHFHADTPHPWEVREQARKLREEVKRYCAEVVDGEKRKAQQGRNAVEEIMMAARDSVAKHSMEETHAREAALQRNHVRRLGDNRMAVARRKWRAEIKRRKEQDIQFAHAFERQHNALSRQIMAAELRHRRDLDGELLAQYVDVRREDNERRKDMVGEEMSARAARAQELADEQVVATQEALELRREEEEEILANARERNRLQRNQHFTLWPGAGGRRLRIDRKPLVLPQVVSAATVEEEEENQPNWSQWTGEDTMEQQGATKYFGEESRFPSAV